MVRLANLSLGRHYVWWLWHALEAVSIGPVHRRSRRRVCIFFSLAATKLHSLAVRWDE
jgi:hypothetical protein